MLTTLLHYRVSLAALKTHNGHPRNLLIHHGLMGSSRNFRTISRLPAVASRFNTHLIDARNHGDSPHTATHTIT
jgi:abhydrolase domain-containing protein 11